MYDMYGQAGRPGRDREKLSLGCTVKVPLGPSLALNYAYSSRQKKRSLADDLICHPCPTALARLGAYQGMHQKKKQGLDLDKRTVGVVHQ